MRTEFPRRAPKEVAAFPVLPTHMPTDVHTPEQACRFDAPTGRNVTHTRRGRGKQHLGWIQTGDVLKHNEVYVHGTGLEFLWFVATSNLKHTVK